MNTKVGFWSAFGALVGGGLGAMSAKYISQSRPRYRYSTESRMRAPAPAPRRKPVGSEVEDAMVIGGAAGALIGGFIGGAAVAPEEPTANPQLPRG